MFVKSKKYDGRASESCGLDNRDAFLYQFTSVLTLAKEWFRSDERSDFVCGQASKSRARDERISAAESDPASRWRDGDGVEESGRSAKPRKAIQGRSTQKINISGRRGEISMAPTQAYLEVWRFRRDGSGKDSSRFRHGELSCDGGRAAHGPRVAHKVMKTNAVDRQLDGGGSGQRSNSSCERRLPA